MRTLRVTFICGVLAASLAICVSALVGIAPFWHQWVGAILLGFGLAWTTIHIQSMPLKIVVAIVALLETAVLSSLMHAGGIQWSPLTALVAGVCATGFGVAYSLSTLGRRRQMVEALFGGRVSCAVFQKIVESDEPFPLAGEKREASVVECRFVNRLELAGTLSAPNFVALFNELSRIGAQALMDSGGVLAQSDGEHLRALFGAPLADPTHATLANKAAIALEERLKTFRQKCRQRWNAEPDCKVSVHSGMMIVGAFGSGLLGGFDGVLVGE